jgi:UDP-GlcNAc:undecaprenyl-phosphate GlcNAc-1-phosphate transferase
MMPIHLIAFLAALALSALLTQLVKPLAVRAGLVSRPRADRWNRKVIPMGGGVAMYLAIALGLIFATGRGADGRFVIDQDSIDLVIALGAVFLLGLVDDKLRLSAPVKLVVQTAAACFLAFRGHTIPFGPDLIRAPITVGWCVFMANSVNLLDNMDGSAAGVSAVAAIFVYVIAATGETPNATLASQAAVISGTACGFLIHNFPPASIFMGDAGSLVLGFALAGISLKLPHGSTRTRTLLAPALALAIPIFDTALVWAARRAAGRPFLLGGRDHTTHRLVALGLSERRTVLTLYAASALLGGAALAVARGNLGVVVLTVLGVAVALLLCGVFLVDVRVYKKLDVGESPAPPLAAPVEKENGSRYLLAIELGLDVLIISSAWIAAYVVKFADTDALDTYLRGSCLKALPFVIGLKLVAFLTQGLYGSFLRSIRFGDLFRILKACALGTILIVAAAAISDRLIDYSREVFLLDALLCVGGVVVSRSAIRALKRSIARLAAEPRRALLVGPKALVPFVERGLARDGSPPFTFVAIIDSDTQPLSEVPRLAEAAGATVVVLALTEPALTEAARAALTQTLTERGITVLGVSVTVE